MTTYTLDLPFTSPPLSLNDRMHWARKAALVKQVRHATHWAAAAKRVPKGCTRASVVLTYYPTTNRQRDTDNLFATLKPCLDGLVDYGLVPDDNDRYILSQCRIGEVLKRGALTLTLDVTE